MAQLGRAPGSGPGGRGFESRCSDFLFTTFFVLRSWVLPMYTNIYNDETSGSRNNLIDSGNRENPAAPILFCFSPCYNSCNAYSRH